MQFLEGYGYESRGKRPVYRRRQGRGRMQSIMIQPRVYVPVLNYSVVQGLFLGVSCLPMYVSETTANKFVSCNPPSSRRESYLD
jgi:hypothetical protein